MIRRNRKKRRCDHAQYPICQKAREGYLGQDCSQQGGPFRSEDGNAAIENGAENKDAAVREAIKKIDQATAKGLLHKNTAARRKSALTKKANA